MRFLKAPALVVGILIALVSAPYPANACPVCTTLPDASLADHLISAEIIVLAGPAPDNPFRFTPKKLIKGTQKDLASLSEIPFLVDSTTRATFLNDPEKSVLFTYGAVDKDAAGRSLSRSWKRIFTLTADREKFLTDLEAAARHWPFDSGTTSERAEFFARYLNSDDLVLRDTALIELDRAPYSVVRALRPKVPIDQLSQEFRNINRISFLPVSIRLLGLQTDDAQAAKIVKSRYEQALDKGSSYAYEWALAGVELDGLAAVETIDNALQMPGRKLENRQNLVRALADAGSVSPNLRDVIISIFSRCLNEDPELALNIAIAARDWQEARLDHKLKAILENEKTDPVTRFVIQTKLTAFD
ncbi:hypothetical protein [Ruegeria arenilitoris]|uniref:hypothetical protein n=1 Tax=Ruegeria arenilitoris TaxID=1173585 RepID=UPI001480142D|nr:hypothetical protein [Ruegeria arenilitoris]